jgi:hypothetical protein
MRLAYIVAGLAYNMTEAGFRMMTLTWFFFLLSAVVIPKAAVQAASPTSSSSPPADTSPKLDEWRSQEPELDFARRRLEAI